jgi:hypothetical protein
MVHICVSGNVVPVVMTVGPSGNEFALQDIRLVYCARATGVFIHSDAASTSAKR